MEGTSSLMVHWRKRERTYVQIVRDVQEERGNKETEKESTRGCTPRSWSLLPFKGCKRVVGYGVREVRVRACLRRRPREKNKRESEELKRKKDREPMQHGFEEGENDTGKKKRRQGHVVTYVSLCYTLPSIYKYIYMYI